MGGIKVKISCGFGTLNCDNDNEIEQILKKCADNPLDDIWISGENEYPCLALLVNRELACIHFFASEEEHYQSVGNEESDGTTKFYAGGEMAELPNYTVVSLSLAIQCVKQFFKSHNRPSCIKWNEI